MMWLTVLICRSKQNVYVCLSVYLVLQSDQSNIIYRTIPKLLEGFDTLSYHPGASFGYYIVNA